MRIFDADVTKPQVAAIEQLGASPPMHSQLGGEALRHVDSIDQPPNPGDALTGMVVDLVAQYRSEALSVHKSFDGLGHTVDFMRPAAMIGAVRIFKFTGYSAPIEAGRNVLYTVCIEQFSPQQRPNEVRVSEYVAYADGFEKYQKVRATGKLASSHYHARHALSREERSRNISAARAERARQRGLGITAVTDGELLELQKLLLRARDTSSAEY